MSQIVEVLHRTSNGVTWAFLLLSLPTLTPRRAPSLHLLPARPPQFENLKDGSEGDAFLRQCFEYLDEEFGDGDGELSVDEWIKGMKYMGEEMEDKEFESQVREASQGCAAATALVSRYCYHSPPPITPSPLLTDAAAHPCSAAHRWPSGWRLSRATSADRVWLSP